MFQCSAFYWDFGGRAYCLKRVSHCYVNFAMEVKMFGELKGLFLFFPLPQITFESRLCCRQQCDEHRRYLLMISQVSGLDPFTEVDYPEYDRWLHSHHSLRWSGDNVGSVYETRKSLIHLASSYHF